MGFLRLHLQSSASTNSPPCHFVTSLLSSLSRGGKSRRLRVESLLRWMIASEDAKNPQKARKQPSSTRIWLAISVYKKGIREWNQGSLRRHKCNVRRSRFLAKYPCISLYCPLSGVAERGEGSGSLRRMLQSARSKRPHRTLCFGRKCNVRRNSDGGGSIWWVESMVLRSWSGDLPGLCVFSWHFVGAL